MFSLFRKKERRIPRRDRELYMTRRVLFYEKRCPYCSIWLEFIERFNMNMNPNKRIELIDCTTWQETGMSNNPLITKYASYIDGFPCLFFEGRKISGANSREECEAFLRVLCANDFKLPERMPPTFDYDCKYVRTIWGKRILCN